MALAIVDWYADLHLKHRTRCTFSWGAIAFVVVIAAQLHIEFSAWKLEKQAAVREQRIQRLELDHQKLMELEKLNHMP